MTTPKGVMKRLAPQAASFAVATLLCVPALAQEPPPTDLPQDPAPAPVTPTPPPSANDTPSPSSPEATPPPPPADGAKTEKNDEDNSGGIFGPFRVGPIVGLGFPNLFNYGITSKLAKTLGLGVNLGHIFNTQMPLMGEATVNYNEIDLYGRIYPFQGGFFVGAGVGYETANATLSKSAQSFSPGAPSNLNITSTGSVTALILAPQLGWLWSFDFGLAIGIDVGAQIPIAPSEITLKTDVPTAVPEPARTTITNTANSTLRDTLKSVGKTPLPMANVRIGWLF